VIYEGITNLHQGLSSQPQICFPKRGENIPTGQYQNRTLKENFHDFPSKKYSDFHHHHHKKIME